ncbi:acyl-CoA thioester hydrolase [Micromonospora coriariae]|uniref:Acyl-CoA thioester hydrolase n=1 Tax=Micromonospora coriariae TaxID=285665 RepID=A0A1C4UJ92_9ACTN|nr:acyl-CoA thioesterase [Micromonospora coriariae]SCE71750.1 acyl-CoA thioester hydrolase [Micromonospora coriariae]
MGDPFRVRITVRGYELDTQGHLNQAVYLQYGEHARWECLRAAGIAQDRLLAAGVGPVAMEVTVKYLRELRGGDEVDVSCQFRWGEGRAFHIDQDYTLPDGTPVARLTGVGGLLDLSSRRLVPDPRGRFRELATDPAPLNL